MSRSRRESVLACALSLVAAGALFLAAGARWAHGTGRRPAGSTFLVVRAAVSGHTVAGVVGAAALVALAGAVAVPATRGQGRRAAGVLLTLGGLAALVGAIVNRGAGRAHVLHALPPGATVVVDPWWVLAALGGLLLSGAGLMLAVRGPGWSALSARYEAPAGRRAAAPPGDAGTWDALDRGEDPTD